jgi:hypothetical protein
MRSLTGALLLAAGLWFEMLTVDVSPAGPSSSKCAAGAAPQLAATFATLYATLGEVMGSPTTCPLVDSEGDTVQATSTGLAIYRQSGLALFASGNQHWALSSSGLENWTGSWHNGFDPPLQSTATTGTNIWSAPDRPVASVRAVILVAVETIRSQELTVVDDSGAQYSIDAEGGCPRAVEALGQYVYVVSNPVTGADSALILLDQHQTCVLGGGRSVAEQ